MKYSIQKVTELGNSMLPCYEIVVKQIPNVFEWIFGARDEEFKCVSDIGAEWFRVPKYQRVKFDSKLDKLLVSVVVEKRRKTIQYLFENIQEIKTKAIIEQFSDVKQPKNQMN